MRDYYSENTDKGIRITISDSSDNFISTGDGVFEEVIGLSIVFGSAIALFFLI